MPYYKIFDMEKVREDASPEAEIQRVKGDNKGEFARPHAHPNEEQFVLIMEGKRYSILGDEERVVGPGDLLHIPRNTRHGAITLTDKVVSFVVKSPAGTGVLGQDYHEAEDVEEVIKRLKSKLEELG